MAKAKLSRQVVWCRLNDPTSSFTSADDLYKKLAVKPEWNGDGNLGVFIVPKNADIWVAEGKIASQKEEYYEFREGSDGKMEQTKGRHCLYKGGGTQLNILTPNESQHGNPYVEFAGVDSKILNDCIFCFRNDGIMKDIGK